MASLGSDGRTMLQTVSGSEDYCVPPDAREMWSFAKRSHVLDISVLVGGNSVATLAVLRSQYQEMLCRELLACCPKSDVPNMVDEADSARADIGRRISRLLGLPLANALAPRQFIDHQFAELTEEFVRRALSAMEHLMPGSWIVSGKGVSPGTDLFGVSRDLMGLQAVLARSSQLRDALGACGVITPDIIIARRPEPDELINAAGEILSERDERIARWAPLRERNQQKPILHAVISCKWTMRGGRAPNARTEVLNLLRNRQGNGLRTMVVTAEPSPVHLVSIAVGADDVDCAYHVALPELVRAFAEAGNEAYIEQLRELVDGRRLRDISDLPLDLAA